MALSSRFWELLHKFGTHFLGDIPKARRITSAHHARKYLQPYLSDGEEVQHQDDDGSSSESGESNMDHGSGSNDEN